MGKRLKDASLHPVHLTFESNPARGARPTTQQHELRKADAHAVDVELDSEEDLSDELLEDQDGSSEGRSDVEPGPQARPGSSAATPQRAAPTAPTPRRAAPTALHSETVPAAKRPRTARGAFAGLVNPGRPGIARTINSAKDRVQAVAQWWTVKFCTLTRATLPPSKARVCARVCCRGALF